MEKLFVNALNNTLGGGVTVHGTNLEEGVVINEVKLNTQIAQSLRTLHQVDSFGKGEVSIVISYIPTEFEGYIFQKDDTIIFIEYVQRSKEIERIVINKEEGEYPSYLLLQAVLLLELATDKSGLDLRSKVMEFVHTPFIRNGSEESNKFASLVRNLENMVSEGIFDPYDETETQEDLSIVSSENILSVLGLTSIAEETAPEETIEKSTEEPTDLTVEVINEAEQISLFDDEPTVEVTKEREVENLESEANFDVDAETVATLVENAIRKGHTPDEIAKAANVAPSTIYGIKDIETLRKSGKNPRKSTLEKITSAIHGLGDVSPTASSVPVSVETPTPVKAESLVKVSPPTASLNDTDMERIIESALTKAIASVSHLIGSPKATLGNVREKAEKVAFDFTQAKILRPSFFDDTWVRVKLKEFEIEEDDINDVIKFRKESREKIMKSTPEAIFDIEPSFFYEGFHEPVETAIDAVLEDLNLLFKGEAGSGKTTLIQSISCLFNLPLYTINGSDDSDIETIVGFKEIDVETGAIVFKEGYLVKAMRVGGIFYSDEANMIRPGILSIINGALDHRRELYIQFVGERIKANQHFRFMAAINEEYEDTRAMNRATLDRSIAFEMTYMTIDVLKSMLRKLDPDMSERDIRMLAQIATVLQQGVRDEVISPEVASIRNIIYLQKMVRRRSFEKAVKRIVDKYPKEDRATIIGVLSAVERLNISADEIVAS